MKGNALALMAVSCVLFLSCGCAFKVGAIGPTSGKGESSFSSGADLRLPLSTPKKMREAGSMLVFPFEEYFTPIERQSNFSKGSLRVGSLGMEFRIVYLLYLKDVPGKIAAPYEKSNLVDSQEPKLHKHRDKTVFYFWFGAGPEYHWNNFVVSQTDRTVAANNNIFYDEVYNNNWGGRVSCGFQTSTFTHDGATGAASGGIGLQLELSYHFGQIHVVSTGTDNSISFRRTREDPFEWISLYTGLVFEF